ncbi:DUF6311 domain-containing protein [Halopseudomonas bauzanensis]|uniref:DUF6311 domain-containing protein n=1 Tax=Halopseudomonas bauzanensis TaxID=653930 RepID=UPI00255604F0|nr:DUF6311 domain-containing protein [Halopseudomonas bauzanensis]
MLPRTWLAGGSSDWYFPLLHSIRINAPEGTSIAFTDSIPLLALLLNPFHPLLPDEFHYFGLWHAFCYLLQACAAVFLIRSLYIRHLSGTLLAVVFALTWPALTHRLGHTALMTHGLLLIALGIYFRGLNNDAWRRGKASTAFIVLSCIALLIHPYLMAMIYPVFIAYLSQQYLRRALSLRHGLLWIASSLLLLLMIMYAGGYFVGKNAAAEGFGIYSMNLTAPFCGGILCSFADATGGQDEGYNYLGAGALLLLSIALITRGGEFLRAGRRHIPLLLMLAAFVLYAASNRIFFGQHAVVDVSLPETLKGLLGVFRVSGRFFWLVGYSVLFATLVILLRRHNWVILAIMAVALLLQWQDTRTLRELVRYQASISGDLNLDLWHRAVADLDGIDIYPAYGCGNTPTEDYVRYQYIAAHLGLTINSAYTARPTGDCDSKHEFAHGLAKPGRMYVKAGFQRNPLDLPLIFREAIAAGECLIDTVHLICAKGRPTTWEAVGLPPEEQQKNITVRWAAAQLPSVIGHMQDTRLVPRERGAVGYLSYGPYIKLPAGTYSHRIEYISQANSTTTVGNWDLVGQDASGKTITVAAGPLMGTRGEAFQLTGALSLSHALQQTELRLFSNGEDLRLEAISISSDISTHP